MAEGEGNFSCKKVLVKVVAIWHSWRLISWIRSAYYPKRNSKVCYTDLFDTLLTTL